MDEGSGAYEAVKVLHLLAVIVGFGGVLLNGAYGARAKQLRGVEGQAVFEATGHVTETFAHKFIFAVPVFGIALVLMSESADFDQTWIWLTIVAYTLAITISLGPTRATVRRMGALMSELNAMGRPPAGATTTGPPPQVAELEALGKKVGAFGGVMGMLFLLSLVLMVAKPV